MKIELYHKMPCPFSSKVRRFIEENGLKNQVVYHDIMKEEGTREKLNELTGKEQVPCLVVDGEPILESDAIIDWIEENLAARQGRGRSGNA